MISALLATTLAALLPQGNGAHQGIPDNLRPVLSYPADPGVQRFDPFTDRRGKALRTTVQAAGAADFDGDGNADLWFLAGGKPGAGRISVQMARTSSLGRFRAWQQLDTGVWVDAASQHTAGVAQQPVVLVDPMSAFLGQVFFWYYPGQPPRSGQFYVNPFYLPVGAGAYAVAARDDEGDGTDDITVLIDAGNGWTQIKKIRMKAPNRMPVAAGEVTALVPAHLEKLHMLDLDADGRSDVLAYAPGFGMLALRDGGAGSFELFLFVPAPSGVRSLFTGDVNRDGKADFGLVSDAGVALWRSEAAGPRAYGLPRPTGAAPLASACILDATSDGRHDIVAFARDGRSFVVYAALPLGGFGPPAVRQPADPTAYAGPGPAGLPVFDADLDGDGDVDILAQLPSGSGWVSLRNEELTCRPSWLIVKDLGSVGETGFRKQQMTVRVPERTLQRGLKEIEAAVFLGDPAHKAHSLYWGRLRPRIDAATGSATFLVYFQTSKTKLPGMIAKRLPHQFADGITAGGEVLLSIHLKSGPRRFESMLVEHDPGGSGGKSAKGVKWKIRAAPPKASADEELLPWD